MRKMPTISLSNAYNYQYVKSVCQMHTIAPALSKEFLDIQATIECGFTLKRVRDMTKTYSHTITICELCI